MTTSKSAATLLSACADRLWKWLESCIAWLRKKPSRITLFLALAGFAIAWSLIIPHAGEWEAEQAAKDGQYMNVRLDFVVQAQKLLLGEEAEPVLDHEISYYYYLASLGNWLGETRPHMLFLYVEIGFALVALSFYPLIVHKLTGNVWFALVSPFLADYLFGRYLYDIKTDSCWMLGWVIFIGVPCLLLLGHADWQKGNAAKRVALCLLICLIIALGNVVRAGASLPIALSLPLVIAYKFFKHAKQGLKREASGNPPTPDRLLPPARRRARALHPLFCFFAACALVAFAWSLCNDTLPRLLFSRYGWKKVYFGPWHSLYSGLGWEANPYGIRWEDANAYAFARSVNPAALPYSEAYFAILKARVFELLRTYPGFILSCYIRKFLLTLRADFAYLRQANVIGYLLVIGYGFLRRRETHRQKTTMPPSAQKSTAPHGRAVWITVCALGVLLSMWTPILANPQNWWYLIGTYTGCQMCLFWLTLRLARRYARFYGPSASV
jgi:hypothetical protein